MKYTDRDGFEGERTNMYASSVKSIMQWCVDTDLNVLGITIIEIEHNVLFPSGPFNELLP
jgi:hypothetical protein